MAKNEKKSGREMLKGRFLTVSLPKKYSDFLREAIPLRGQEVFGPQDTHGRASAYIVKLVMRDLLKAGYINKSGEPQGSRLVQAKKNIAKKRENDSWFDDFE